MEKRGDEAITRVGKENALASCWGAPGSPGAGSSPWSPGLFPIDPPGTHEKVSRRVRTEGGRVNTSLALPSGAHQKSLGAKETCYTQSTSNSHCGLEKRKTEGGRRSWAQTISSPTARQRGRSRTACPRPKDPAPAGWIWAR